MELIKAVKKDQKLLDEIFSTAKEKEGFRLWWLGQSGYLIQWKGKHLLIDPYLSDSLTHKYAETDKPHIRMSELVINPEQLNFIDYVTSSHNHTDHLDGETLIPLIQANPNVKMVIPEANRQFVCDRIKMPKEFPIGLEARQAVELDGLWIHGIPAAHEALSTDSQGRNQFMGYVFEFGPWTIYHSGDTMLYPEIHEFLSPFNINMAILPINGRAPERRVAGNLNAKEAIQLAKDLGVSILIPCHYDMFTFNTANVEDFKKMAESEEQGYIVLEHGERITERVFI